MSRLAGSVLGVSLPEENLGGYCGEQFHEPLHSRSAYSCRDYTCNSRSACSCRDYTCHSRSACSCRDYTRHSRSAYTRRSGRRRGSGSQHIKFRSSCRPPDEAATGHGLRRCCEGQGEGSKSDQSDHWFSILIGGVSWLSAATFDHIFRQALPSMESRAALASSAVAYLPNSLYLAFWVIYSWLPAMTRHWLVVLSSMT